MVIYLLNQINYSFTKLLYQVALNQNLENGYGVLSWLGKMLNPNVPKEMS